MEPAPGINVFDYSVRWSGYLKAPVDGIWWIIFKGDYTFRMKIACAGRLIINGDPVIIHNFNFDIKESPPQSIFDLNHEERVFKLDKFRVLIEMN